MRYFFAWPVKLKLLFMLLFRERTVWLRHSDCVPEDILTQLKFTILNAVCYLMRARASTFHYFFCLYAHECESYMTIEPHSVRIVWKVVYDDNINGNKRNEWRIGKPKLYKNIKLLGTFGWWWGAFINEPNKIPSGDDHSYRVREFQL